jgi:hypothetical protein
MPVISFWLNAFIPRTVAGYTKILTAGPHAGKTAIPLPGIARTWPGNTAKDWNAGYLTDQRGFDPSAGASVRMQSLAEVVLGQVPALVKQAHRSSGTTEVNLVSGVQTGFAVANMSRCGFTVVPPSGPPGGFGAHLAAGRGGPAYPISKAAARAVRVAEGAPDRLSERSAGRDGSGYRLSRHVHDFRRWHAGISHCLVRRHDRCVSRV